MAINTVELIETIKNSCDMLDNIDEYISGLNEELSICDLRTQDMLHLVENERMASAQCYRVIKELKEIRKKRRKVKNDIIISNVLSKNRNKLIEKNNRTMLLAEVFKTQKNIGLKYEYKNYSEEEISEIMK